MKYVKEVAFATGSLGRATGRMFEHEHVRFNAMYTAARGPGGRNQGARVNKGIMEHRVTHNLKAVDGDKSIFRQRHQWLLAKYREYKEIVYKLAGGIVLGRSWTRSSRRSGGGVEKY